MNNLTREELAVAPAAIQRARVGKKEGKSESTTQHHGQGRRAW